MEIIVVAIIGLVGTLGAAFLQSRKNQSYDDRLKKAQLELDEARDEINILKGKVYELELIERTSNTVIQFLTDQVSQKDLQIIKKDMLIMELENKQGR